VGQNRVHVEGPSITRSESTLVDHAVPPNASAGSHFEALIAACELAGPHGQGGGGGGVHVHLHMHAHTHAPFDLLPIA
jgi:hypothetical protein